ncbi:MAG: permease [Kiritimatiellae bacterium]|nr:permease [Kiritimatiellia bacterium]
MSLREQWRPFVWLAAAFAAAWFLPVGQARFDNALGEALQLVRWYAREHVIFCLLPAFWIAGAIGTFLSQSSVMRYLGPAAPKPVAYGVAAVSGTVLAVCSCTVLPLFAGIYMMGAGLGPAAAFLYSGPAINVLAVILTATILGPQLGIARALGAVVFALAVGLAMAGIFRHSERSRQAAALQMPVEDPARPLWQNVLLIATLILGLVAATWGPGDPGSLQAAVFAIKWWITGAIALGLAAILAGWFAAPRGRLALVAGAVVVLSAVLPSAEGPYLAGILGLGWVTAGRRGDLGDWFAQSWQFTKQIMPLLLGGVLVAGFLLGRSGAEGVVPGQWVAEAVGGNGLAPNLFAAVAGAFMYFATLTEVPILQGLLGSGMGLGPALALLLAGPALSLPNMLVIRSVIGWQKTSVFVALVVIMATVSGLLFGALVR